MALRAATVHENLLLIALWYRILSAEGKKVDDLWWFDLEC